MIETGTFVHTTLAHPNNVYEVLEVGTDWLLVDDNTTMKLSIPTDSATVHEYCGNKWCRACHRSSYDGLSGDIVFYVRKTGQPFAETAHGKFERLHYTLAEHGIKPSEIAEILKDVDPTDEKTVKALQFFADRLVK
jgi:hypothetical protein